MPAKILMIVSAVIALTLGCYHFYFTFHGPLLTPRDPALQTAMAQTAPVISPDTTMWRLWLGFNASHSMGLILFGLVFGYLALAHDRTLFSSPFLLAIGLAMLSGMAVLCKLYFFNAPLRRIAIAWLCYFAAILVSRISLAHS